MPITLLIRKYPYLFIVLAGALLFVPFAGGVHLFDWDEINFAECAREMLVSGKYLYPQINFQPFWEKPPLFIWLSALSMKAFGINEFAARLPNAICGIITLCVIYGIGKKLHDERTGFLWVLFFACSTLPHFYFRSGIIDPWFNLFIFCAIYCLMPLVRSGNEQRQSLLRNAAAAAVFTGLAVLTKGPAAVIVIFFVVFFYIALNRFRNIRWSALAWFTLLSMIFSGSWFLILIANGQWAIIREFVLYQVHLFKTGDAGHDGPIYYHLVVLFFGCFPASIFAIGELASRYSASESQRVFRRLMVMLLVVVLVLFSIVKTKIVHYSSLCYFPLTYLAALSAERLTARRSNWTSSRSVLLLIAGGMTALAATALPFIGMNAVRVGEKLIVNDHFTAECLKAPVDWSGIESLGGVVLLVSLIGTVVAARRKRYVPALILVCAGNLVFVQTSLYFFAPRIEGYTQRTSVEFYSSLKDEKCYVYALNYHSYAQYFYAGTREAQPRGSELLNGELDRVVYFVCKDFGDNPLVHYPQLELIGKRNGYLFYRRLPASQ